MKTKGTDDESKLKMAAQLIIDEKDLAFQKVERKKCAEKLIVANKELKNSKKSINEYKLGLEKIMFTITHKVRTSVANVLGVLNVFNQTNNSQSLNIKLFLHFKQYAADLYEYTIELTSLTTKKLIAHFEKKKK